MINNKEPYLITYKNEILSVKFNDETKNRSTKIIDFFKKIIQKLKNKWIKIRYNNCFVEWLPWKIYQR